MNEENQTIIKALNIFGRVPEQYELLNEIERLNNKIKEQNLLLIEFQDMEQRLKLKDNIINELHSELKTLWVVLWNMDTENDWLSK